MRTIIYIDGFNLYKAALSKTPHKWLDLRRLFEDHVIPTAEPRSSVTKIKFFTARVKGALCRNPESPDRQARYILALTKYYDGLVEVIEGNHSAVQTAGRMVEPVESAHCGEWVKIEKMEEKQTDVNIALHMYRDCAQGRCDHAVLVSNDSDLAPVVETIKHDFPHIVCGVITPSRARKSRSLTDPADWARDGISDEELKSAQLPSVIEYRTGLKNKLKRLTKPAGW